MYTVGWTKGTEVKMTESECCWAIVGFARCPEVERYRFIA